MSGYYLLYNGEFAYNKSYSVGYDFGSIKRLDRYPMGALSTLYICFGLKKYNTDFMKVYFDSLKWYKEIYMIAAEGARNHGLLNVPTDEFFDTRHVLPTSEAEQSKIAIFFNLLEARIEKQQRLVTALKSYKRGVSSQIFGRSGYMPNGYASPYPKWRETTIGEIFYERCERGRGDEELLAVTISNGVQRRSEIELKDNSSEYKENYKIVRRGDIAYNTMRMWQGACGASNYDGIVSPAYTVICPRNAENTCIDFWIYYFKEKQMLNLFQKYSQGLTSDIWNLKYTQLKDIPIVVPCVCEQRRISSLLLAIDARLQAECGKLDQMERLKKALLHKMFL